MISLRVFTLGYFLLHFAILVFYIVGTSQSAVALVAPSIGPSFALNNDSVATHPESFVLTAFMHYGIIHLYFNCIAFSWCVRIMAVGRDQVSWSSVGKTVLLYGAGLVGSSSLILLFPANSGIGTVGASGAILALIGYVLIHHRYRLEFYGLIISMGLLIVLTIFINISWQAHLGGLIVGVAAAVIANVVTYLHHKSLSRQLFQAYPHLTALHDHFKPQKLGSAIFGKFFLPSAVPYLTGVELFRDYLALEEKFDWNPEMGVSPELFYTAKVDQAKQKKDAPRLPLGLPISSYPI